MLNYTFYPQLTLRLAVTTKMTRQEYIIAKLSRLKYFQEPYQVLGSWYRSAANMTDPKPLILRNVQRLHKLVNELKMGTKESQLMKSNT